jgi:hypothetical protein
VHATYLTTCDIGNPKTVFMVLTPRIESRDRRRGIQLLT